MLRLSNRYFDEGARFMREDEDFFTAEFCVGLIRVHVSSHVRLSWLFVLFLVLDDWGKDKCQISKTLPLIGFGQMEDLRNEQP
jgi:hypothetical protein